MLERLDKWAQRVAGIETILMESMPSPQQRERQERFERKIFGKHYRTIKIVATLAAFLAMCAGLVWLCQK